jgi:carbon-monoxide dehydrogenase small subunit
MAQRVAVRVRVNGETYDRSVEPRLLLSDFLRHDLGLTGTHVGCEHGVCGACTVLLDGESVRSCLMLTPQAHEHDILTVEGLAPRAESREPRADGTALHPLQEAFREAHGLQCGFCTPGMLMTLLPFLRENPAPSDDEIREAISGNLCRCTGYQNIVHAAQLAAHRATSPTQSMPVVPAP